MAAWICVRCAMREEPEPSEVVQRSVRRYVARLRGTGP
jgi:hypothetical protein